MKHLFVLPETDIQLVKSMIPEAVLDNVIRIAGTLDVAKTCPPKLDFASYVSEYRNAMFLAEMRLGCYIDYDFKAQHFYKSDRKPKALSECVANVSEPETKNAPCKDGFIVNRIDEIISDIIKRVLGHVGKSESCLALVSVPKLPVITSHELYSIRKAVCEHLNIGMHFLPDGTDVSYVMCYGVVCKPDNLVLAIADACDTALKEKAKTN